MKSIAYLSVFFILGTFPAFGAIINGDFSNGLDHYRATASTNQSGNVDPAPYATVVDNASNPLVQVTSDPEINSEAAFVPLPASIWMLEPARGTFGVRRHLRAA